ncbi:hypothetical protein [Paenibacillus guangzhouensis]|uniref:hypothetical protein n=1 Tax=Paenibacillus guangzhouensis TaxID=1473112 RepID=UPI00126732C4|nr:hypothetical protein [Paenibacillus guangzhouensis]
MNLNTVHTVSMTTQLSSPLRKIEIFQLHEPDHTTTLVLKLSNGIRIGWGEYRMQTSPPTDLVKWAATYHHLAGMNALQAIDYLVRFGESWPPAKVHLMESALLDLCNTIEPTPCTYPIHDLTNMAIAYYIFILE